MAGLYIHIPFCKRKCLYCDFYSCTDLSVKDAYVDALVDEMSLRRKYITKVDTIYFGGGTPSLMSAKDFVRIFSSINKLFDLSNCAEITVEINPDDITPEYADALAELPFNRVSIGIQTFDDDELHFLNRRHDALQAVEAVKRCQDAGFTNISIDLIYGLPGQTLSSWDKNLECALALGVPHISAYHLIYEENTPITQLKDTGKIIPVDEDTSLLLFSRLIERLSVSGYEHYEISNFSLPGYRSRHNSSYWDGTAYLGLGPFAHSYNGCDEREWNIASLPAYLEGIRNRSPRVTSERLDLPTRYNEYIITRLRTKEGFLSSELERRFGKELFAYCLRQAERYIASGMLLREENDRIRLSEKGIFVSDSIMCDLMKV